ncbi:hypothetical protein BC936DRAFT_139968 [Jimgerdemannia flammicorona]|uniref:Uncharacterized protein n=1 Tax=Jimgerdemannia flammicorona TaxID=994334 RepID=A0A433B8X1_9FUNG|nr:hypothetical protein BC936DRAFT_139968 [Jimgerdemannia flammicorona]
MDLSNFAPHASTIDPMRKVPVENARTLTTQQFDKKYDRPALPVLIENAGVEQWKAWESWRVERLCEKVGAVVLCLPGTGNAVMEVSLL